MVKLICVSVCLLLRNVYSDLFLFYGKVIIIIIVFAIEFFIYFGHKYVTIFKLSWFRCLVPTLGVSTSWGHYLLGDSRRTFGRWDLTGGLRLLRLWTDFLCYILLPWCYLAICPKAGGLAGYHLQGFEKKKKTFPFKLVVSAVCYTSAKMANKHGIQIKKKAYKYCRSYPSFSWLLVWKICEL